MLVMRCDACGELDEVVLGHRGLGTCDICDICDSCKLNSDLAEKHYGEELARRVREYREQELKKYMGIIAERRKRNELDT